MFARCCASVGRPYSRELRSLVKKKKEKETTDSAKFVAKLKKARNSIVQHCPLGTESRKAGENSPENWEKI